MNQEASAGNPELKVALAQLSPEQRSRLSRAGTEAIVAALDELVASRRALQEREGQGPAARAGELPIHDTITGQLPLSANREKTP